MYSFGQPHSRGWPFSFVPIEWTPQAMVYPAVNNETPTRGTPTPYTPGEFADLCEDDMGAAHNASYRELAEGTGMTAAEFQAFCEEQDEEPTECTDAMGGY